jgi:hypothetical protein
VNFIDRRNFREDHFQAVVTKDARTGRERLKLITPSMVVHIADKDELKHQLRHYHRPFIRDVVPDTTTARKNYVEHVRPALRYWCAKFGIEVPHWLKGEDDFVKLSDTKKMELFGTTELHILEFRKWKRTSLAQVKEEHGLVAAQ